MRTGENLAGKFLVAMPSLEDPNFERSVVFMCAHSHEGALGLVINQPHPASIDDVFEQLEIDWGRRDKPRVLQGGPVSPERGFILYEEMIDVPGFLEVTPDLYMASNPEILHRLGSPGVSNRFLFTLGYSGWGASQLEMELRQNAWLVCQLDRHLLFDLHPEERWSAALRLMGIDPAQLVDAGSSMN